MKIAISGKGGVGKTIIAAGLGLNLAKKNYNIILIDMDSNPNLGRVLGLDIDYNKFSPLSENKALIEEKTGVSMNDLVGMYRLSFEVKDIIDRFALKGPFNIKLLVVGRIKDVGSGCMCPANALVRMLMKHIILERKEAIIMDMEAGLEHLGRETINGVDYNLVISEPTLRSLETAMRIIELSSKIVPNNVLIINKVKENIEYLEKFYNLKVKTFLLHYDEMIANMDIKGGNLLEVIDSKFMNELNNIVIELLKR